MISGLTVVQDQQNTPLPAASVTPSDPADSEEGAIGAGETVAPELNTHGLTEGITIPDADTTPDGAPAISGDQVAGRPYPGDNDSQYIDDILWPNPDTFQPTAEMVAENLYSNEKLHNLKPQTKVLSATVTIGTLGAPPTLYDPVMLFPADGDRVELILRAIPKDLAAITKWRFASDKSSCYTAAELTTLDGAIRLEHHTGPVWVYSTSVDTFQLSGWSVTT